MTLIDVYSDTLQPGRRKMRCTSFHRKIRPRKDLIKMNELGQRNQLKRSGNQVCSRRMREGGGEVLSLTLSEEEMFRGKSDRILNELAEGRIGRRNR